MTMFSFKPKTDKVEDTKVQTNKVQTTKNVPVEQENTESVESVDRITVTRGNDEATLEISKKGFTLIVNDYDFVIRRDSTYHDKKFRLLGIGGSLVLNEDELDYIYSEFKRFIND